MSNLNRNNQRGEQRVQEDVPEYRSVMIRPLAPPPMARSFAPPAKLARATPELPVGGPDSFTKATVPLAQFASWQIPEPVALPAGYLLERTNGYVDNGNVQTVADRICTCLREQSIAATTNNPDEDKNLLLAETQDCVKIAVRLFTCNGAVVVEVQRTAGCSFAFREAAKSVLRSAKGLPRVAATKRSSFPSAVPRRSLEVLQQCVKDDYDIAYSMLQSEKYDSQMLGLESLEKMTSSCEAVDMAAKSVLSCDCLRQLLSLLDAHMDLAMEDMKDTHSHILRRKALAVLANACAGLEQADLAQILATNDHDLKTRSFLDMLVSTLRDAAGRPHDAVLAARCLKSLLVSKEVEETIVEMSAMEVASSAYSAGCHSHELLETESKYLMDRLRNVQC